MKTTLEGSIADLGRIVESVIGLKGCFRDPKVQLLVNHSYHHLQDALLTLQVLSDLEPLLDESDSAVAESPHHQDSGSKYLISELMKHPDLESQGRAHCRSISSGRKYLRRYHG